MIETWLDDRGGRRAARHRDNVWGARPSASVDRLNAESPIFPLMQEGNGNG